MPTMFSPICVAFCTFYFSQIEDFNFGNEMGISAKFMEHPIYVLEKIPHAAKIETIVPLFIL